MCVVCSVWRVRAMDRCGSCFAACCITPPPTPPNPASCTTPLPGHRHRYTLQPSSCVLSNPTILSFNRFSSIMANFCPLTLPVIFEQRYHSQTAIVSVLHQNEGGIGKSIPNAQEISRRRRGWISQYLPSFGGIRTFSSSSIDLQGWIRKSIPLIRKGLTMLKSILPC